MKSRLTKEDVLKIEKEIEKRKLEIRPQLIEAVKEARAFGDLSENFEYYAAKREKNQNESRIRYLEGLLKFSDIIEKNPNKDTISIGNIVRIYNMDEDEEECYKIVSSISSNSLENRISIESPLGKALIGHKIGDIIDIHINNLISYKVKILSIDIDTSDYEIRSF